MAGKLLQVQTIAVQMQGGKAKEISLPTLAWVDCDRIESVSRADKAIAKPGEGGLEWRPMIEIRMHSGKTLRCEGDVHLLCGELGLLTEGSPEAEAADAQLAEIRQRLEAQAKAAEEAKAANPEPAPEPANNRPALTVVPEPEQA
jgi:hypothetical protein